MTKADTGFTQVINVERLGREPVTFNRIASAEDCTDIAANLGIVSLADLKIEGKVQRQKGSDKIALNAKLSAKAVQECVVSLEDVPEELVEEFTVFYTFDPNDLTVEEVEYVVGADEPDLPELIVDNEIDLAAIVSEHIALALDPYPRLEKYRSMDGTDSVLIGDVDESEKDVYKPFANLKDLMDKK
ncbi:MAG: DUF177 domain-containing protein [Proteobacteria bacterium]|nr:DUF177 domain-containing protein [Pseudomonadota bacterium]